MSGVCLCVCACVYFNLSLTVMVLSRPLKAEVKNLSFSSKKVEKKLKVVVVFQSYFDSDSLEQIVTGVSSSRRFVPHHRRGVIMLHFAGGVWEIIWQSFSILG
jgi:hypothetical protein